MSTDWNQRYRERTTPWDSGLPSRELRRVLDEGLVAPCRAAELGCGTGTNAVFLAQRGFDVTALDVSSVALEVARARAADASVSIDFQQADLCRLDRDLGTYSFVFDRGCYHCARKIDLAGYLDTLRRLTATGSKYLVIAGNANEQTEVGPPRVTEQEIRADLEPLFRIEFLREARFEDAGHRDGPLGWGCLLVRSNE